MIILGVDPGTATTGYGVIKIETQSASWRTKLRADAIRVLDYGCIITEPDKSAGDRLKKISIDLNKLIRTHKPDVLAVENLYFFKNLKTALPVSQAKGVILLAAARKNIPVYEFTPLQVKMAVTGYGKAEKKQVQKIVENLLKLKDVPQKKDQKKDDATDALGIALCYLASNKKITFDICLS